LSVCTQLNFGVHCVWIATNSYLWACTHTGHGVCCIWMATSKCAHKLDESSVAVHSVAVHVMLCMWCCTCDAVHVMLCMLFGRWSLLYVVLCCCSKTSIWCFECMKKKGKKLRRQWKPLPTSIKEKEPLWYPIVWVHVHVMLCMLLGGWSWGSCTRFAPLRLCGHGVCC